MAKTPENVAETVMETCHHLGFSQEELAHELGVNVSTTNRWRNSKRVPFNRPPQYERVMLPLTVLRRFDAVLAEKEKMLALLEEKYAALISRAALITAAVTGQIPMEEMRQ